MEQALLDRPGLHRALAIPRSIRTTLARLRGCRDDALLLRVMRFDFHPTDQGWRVSEVNSDVPGGYNEASGWTALVAEHVPDAVPAGDPVQRLAEAMTSQSFTGATVALVCATGYTDDRQVMAFLARRLEQHDLRPVLVAPDHLRWVDVDLYKGVSMRFILSSC